MPIGKISAFCLLLALVLISPLHAQTSAVIEMAGVENFYHVNDVLYRSGQPSAEGMRRLEAMGIKSVLNLREYHSDSDEAEGTALNLHHIPVAAGSIGDKEVIEALRFIKNADKPVLVHCWHGSDRTGTVVAMYRIIFEDYTKEAALKELMLPQYGHHRRIYKNIPEYIRNADIDYIRGEVFK